MACHNRCVNNGVDEQRLSYYSCRRGRSPFSAAKEYVFADTMRYVLQVRCLAWAPFLLQVGWQVSIHTSHTIMLVDDISVLLARVVDTYDYLHSKLGLFWFIRRHVRSLKSILSLDCDTGDASEITKHWISKVDQVVFSCRRPRWLGRLSSCLLKSISRVQFSPSAHTRRDFSLHKKMISGKRESVS